MVNVIVERFRTNHFFCCKFISSTKISHTCVKRPVFIFKTCFDCFQKSFDCMDIGCSMAVHSMSFADSMCVNCIIFGCISPI